MARLGETGRRKKDQDSLRKDLPELQDYSNIREVKAASNKVMYCEIEQYIHSVLGCVTVTYWVGRSEWSILVGTRSQKRQ